MENLLMLKLAAPLALKGLHKASSCYDSKIQSFLKYCDHGANPALLYLAGGM
jgi:hypothetical protein